MELRGAPGHVVEDRVQARQPAVHLVGVRVPGRGVQRAQVVEDVGEDQAGEVGVPDAGAQHVLDGGVRAVAELAELVDRLPVPVPGEAAGPGGVLKPVQDLVVGEGVEPAAQRGEVIELADVLVQSGQLRQGLGDVFRYAPARGARHGGAQARAAPTGTRDGRRGG